MNDGLVEVHMSRVAEWLLRTVGRVLLLAMLAVVILGIIGLYTEAAGWFGLAGLVGPLIFGAVLYQAEAPAPYTDVELGGRCIPTRPDRVTGASFARVQRPRNVRANNGLEHWQRRTETPLLVLAVVFLAVLLAPYVFSLSDTASRIIFLLNVAIWIVFAVDYLARLYLALDRWVFVRGNVVDLLIVLLPMLRPFRALRLLRVLRLSAVAGMAQKRAAGSLHTRVTAYVVTAVLAAVVAAGAGVREAERGSPDANIRSLADGLVGATTVLPSATGDRYPTTLLGDFVAVGADARRHRVTRRRHGIDSRLVRGPSPGCGDVGRRGRTANRSHDGRGHARTQGSPQGCRGVSTSRLTPAGLGEQPSASPAICRARPSDRPNVH